MQLSSKLDFFESTYSRFDLSYLIHELAIKKSTQLNFNTVDREVPINTLASNCNREMMVALYRGYSKTGMSGLLKPLIETNKAKLLTTVSDFLGILNKITHRDEDENC